MKEVAILILAVVISVAILEPITEFGVMLNEKVKTSSAMSNAMEVAKGNSLDYEELRDMNAVVDQSMFMEEFEDAFEVAMDVSTISRTGTTSTFRSYDGKMNDIVVTLQFHDEVHPTTGKITSTVKVNATSGYKFKTKLLQEAAASIATMDFDMVTERTYLLEVAN